jgi:uncharacterized Tic20 family protein
MSQPFSSNPFTSPAPPPPKTDGPPNKDDCTMAMLAHLLGAFTSFVGPLIIWLIKKDHSSFVDDQGKEALNFQLSVFIIHIACGAIAVASCGILAFIIAAPYLFGLIFGILAAVEANKGVAYRYPVTIRMIH